MEKKIKDLTIELTKILSVVGSPEENDVVDYIYNWFKNIDYFRENPEGLRFIQAIDDPIGRRSVLATIRGNKGTSNKTIVFIGHTDTVGISDYGDIKEYSTRPFEL